jgi:hypothetical protein
MSKKHEPQSAEAVRCSAGVRPRPHNRSTKKHARLCHALWQLANPTEAELNKNWNAKYRLKKWGSVLPESTGNIFRDAMMKNRGISTNS